MNKAMLAIVLWVTMIPPLAHADTEIKPYPSHIRSLFINNCSDKKQAHCKCLIDKSEQLVPYEKFLSDIRKMGVKFIREHPYKAIGIACHESTQVNMASESNIEK